MTFERFQEERKFAEKRLTEAVQQSQKIADETVRIKKIQSKINAVIASRDIEWERKRWFTQNLDALFEWASTDAKLPPTREIDRFEAESKTMVVALEQLGFKLLSLRAAQHAAASEELECQSRILHLEAMEANWRAQAALQSVAEYIGADASVNVQNGDAELAQQEADRLLEESHRERRQAEQIVAELQAAQKGKK